MDLTSIVYDKCSYKMQLYFLNMIFLISCLYLCIIEPLQTLGLRLWPCIVMLSFFSVKDGGNVRKCILYHGFLSKMQLVSYCE